jgi:hypothetical protein
MAARVASQRIAGLAISIAVIYAALPVGAAMATPAAILRMFEAPASISRAGYERRARTVADPGLPALAFVAVSLVLARGGGATFFRAGAEVAGGAADLHLDRKLSAAGGAVHSDGRPDGDGRDLGPAGRSGVRDGGRHPGRARLRLQDLCVGAASSVATAFAIGAILIPAMVRRGGDPSRLGRAGRAYPALATDPLQRVDRNLGDISGPGGRRAGAVRADHRGQPCAWRGRTAGGGVLFAARAVATIPIQRIILPKVADGAGGGLMRDAGDLSAGDIADSGGYGLSLMGRSRPARRPAPRPLNRARTGRGQGVAFRVAGVAARAGHGAPQLTPGRGATYSDGLVSHAAP